jgi:ubiquinone/menaquinone biosynthesis C-methylase UbiE/intracellular sulfur oxidation DsrE/DsrF family protein
MGIFAQEQSVKPGINDSFKNPDVDDYLSKFEVESREIFAQRDEIVKRCSIKPGMELADIGAGTGLFTRLFSSAVGENGNVIAVDISQKFLDHIDQTCRTNGIKNVQPLLCTSDSTKLPADSIDVAFICDTYHHFEFPAKTLSSLRQALKLNGRIIVIDFIRIPGESTEWTLNHVRAGQEVFESEIIQAGFLKTREEKNFLKQNYFVEFTKSNTPGLASPIYPIIEGYGAVVQVPASTLKPTAGAKIVFDVTNNTPPADINKGLDRAARLLNLYGATGLKAADINISLIFHGESTKTILNNETYAKLYQVEKNPNLDLLQKLQAAGVEIVVCGQALNYKGFPTSCIIKEIPIADAALTFVVTKQASGYGYQAIP